jgi:hypothetical protein
MFFSLPYGMIGFKDVEKEGLVLHANPANVRNARQGVEEVKRLVRLTWSTGGPF